MVVHSLATDERLRAACEALSDSRAREGEMTEWTRQLAATIEWVRGTSEEERRTREFQERLWEHNHVAAVGQGNIPIDRAFDDAAFRQWLAAKSMVPLPASTEARLPFLTDLYEQLKGKLGPISRAVPHLKIFRVMAALYPEAMTTVASAGMLHELTRAMGSGRRLPPVERHLWVRERLDKVLGPAATDAKDLAARMSLPWMLYERFVQATEPTEKETAVGEQTKLLPLPAARRRRGLTAIRGLFPAVLSTLEFVRDGVTRPELVEFLRAASPESKASSLGMAINVLQSELAVIKADGGRYVLTQRGEDVLESQDPSHLADWILTRILGADKALVELRDRGPLSRSELTAAIRSMNPGWTADFAPQTIISWLRSMGVIDSTEEYRQRLTEVGREWASRIHWQPEPLAPDPDDVLPRPTATPTTGLVALPDLSTIISSMQQVGHFPGPLVARLHAGIWAHTRRHLAILTGLSGSGKTLLARAYGRALAQDGRERQVFVLPVQPGWYDPGALLGFVNPLRGDSYVRTAFLEFLIAAAGDPDRPYVAVLDEMNLSHPEQYMAPLLSAMETGDAIQLHTEDDIFDGVPRSIPYPANLVLIGTINMDETTHGLSDKVLDRAFVLEFWDVDLAAYPRWGQRSVTADQEARVRDVLSALMQALAPARLHFGWRVVDDVLDFIERASSSSDLSFGAALDAVIYAKVLPKLRGEDAPRFREALGRSEAVLGTFGLEQSKAKVAELKRDLETTGSARFWR